MAVAIEKIKKRCVVNLAGLHDTLEDKEYYKIVRRSLTAEQFDAYENGQTASAMLLVQAIVMSVVHGAEAICTAAEGCVEADENGSNAVEDSGTCKDKSIRDKPPGGATPLSFRAPISDGYVLGGGVTLCRIGTCSSEHVEY